jgi:hypothetical protein
MISGALGNCTIGYDRGKLSCVKRRNACHDLTAAFRNGFREGRWENSGRRVRAGVAGDARPTGSRIAKARAVRPGASMMTLGEALCCDGRRAEGARSIESRRSRQSKLPEVPRADTFGS